MEKFLSIPVTSQGNQLVSVSGIKLIDAASATETATTIAYAGGKVTTVTSAAQVAFSMRDFLQDSMVEALQSPWRQVVHQVTPPQAVSEIAVA